MRSKMPDGDPELARFVNGDFLVTHVDHEQRIGQRGHVADTAEAAQQFIHFTVQDLCLFLAAPLERAVLRHIVQFVQPLDGLANGAIFGFQKRV
jgi:hypothetical protein